VVSFGRTSGLGRLTAMIIRPATTDDAEALASLHLDVWEEA